MRSILSILLILISRLNATGQTETDGTIIVFNSSEKEFVIAADSRTSGTRTYADDDCKISAFGNKVIFTVSGRAGTRNKPTEYWDAHAIAKENFNRLAAKIGSDNFTIELAQAWGMAIKIKIEERRDRGVTIVGGLNANDPMMSAPFAGVRRDGSVTAVMETVDFEVGTNRKIQISYSPPYTLRNTDAPNWMGEHEVIDELKRGGTFQSDQWRRKIDATVRASHDQIAAVAIEQVRLTIDNLPPSKKTVKGVSFSVVGYPISAARLTGKGVEWIEKGHCPQK